MTARDPVQQKEHHVDWSQPGTRFPLPFEASPFEPPASRRARVEDGVIIREDLVFAASEGWRPLMLDLYIPENVVAAPLVIYVHGGAWLGGSHKPLHQDFVHIEALWSKFIDAGIAVASVSYRHSAEAQFPAQIHDVKAAIRWLRFFANELGLDPQRIGLFGDSAGGHLALLAAQNTEGELEGEGGVADVDSSVAAVAAWFPVTSFADLTDGLGSIPAERASAPFTLLLGGWPDEVPELAAKASPAHWVSCQSPPLLLVHGDVDALVPLSQSEIMFRRYQEAGAEADLLVLPGVDHALIGTDPDRVMDRTVDHFTRHLIGTGSGAASRNEHLPTGSAHLSTLHESEHQ